MGFGAGGFGGIGGVVAGAFTEPPCVTILVMAEAARSRNGFSEHQLGVCGGLWRLLRNPMAAIGGRVEREQPLVVPQGVAELFGYRLAKSVGVRVAPVSLSEREPDSFEGFIKRVPNGWAISPPVPKALPVYYLRGLCKTIPPSFPLDEGELYNFWRKCLDKRCPVDRTTYADFPDPAPDVALEVAKWDSPERLLGHAYRAFLHASHAHTSNTLVDVEGRLWLIDNAAIVFRSDTDDIEALHVLVERCPDVMKICRRISSMTPNDISAALYGIPWGFWARDLSRPISGPSVEFKWESQALNYFTNRLEAWRKHFPPIEGEQGTGGALDAGF